VARTTTSSTQAVVAINATKSSSARLTRSTDFEASSRSSSTLNTSWVPRNDPDQDLARRNEKPSPALQKYEADRSAWESGSMLSGDKASGPASGVSRVIESTSTNTQNRGFDPKWDIPKDEKETTITLRQYEDDKAAWESDSIPSRPKAAPIATTSRALPDSTETRDLLEPEESWIPRDNEVLSSAAAQAANESSSTAMESANESRSLPARQQQPPRQMSAVPAGSKRSIRHSSSVPAAAKTKSAHARSARVDFTGAVSMDDSQEFKWVPEPEKSTVQDGKTSISSVQAALTASTANSESEEGRSVSSEVKRTREIVETVASAAPYYYEPDDATSEAPDDENSDNFRVHETACDDDATDDGLQVFQQEPYAGKEEHVAAVMRSIPGESVNSESSNDQSETLENVNVESANNDSNYDSTMSFVMDLEEMEAQREAPYDALVKTSSRVSFGGEETIVFDDSEDQFSEESRAKSTCRLSRLQLLSLCILLLVIPVSVAVVVVLLFKDDDDNNAADRSTTVTGTSSPIASPDPTPRPITTPPTTLSPTTAPTESPTIPVTEAPVLSLVPQPPTRPPIPSVDALIQLLSGVSADGGAALRDPSSPQYRAMQWIRSPNNTGIYEDSRFIQRYALSVLYHSTGGESWSRSRFWLTGANECDWYLAETGTPTCDADGNIVTIALAANNLNGPLPRELALLARSLGEYQVRVNDVNNKTGHIS
jgi:hypothetical protein